MGENFPVSILCDNLALLEQRRHLSNEQYALALDMLIDTVLDQYRTDSKEELYQRFLTLAPYADGIARARFCQAPRYSSPQCS